MEKTILQYQISDWAQLSKCQSNNSPDLHIRVSKFINNDDLEGTRISIYHEIYGDLFVYVIGPKGDLVSNDIYCRSLNVITPDILLNELMRFGFYVDYQEEYHLSTGQVNLLRTIQGLKFDKIRVLAVHDDADTSSQEIYVVAFNIQSNEFWINSGYSPSRSEYESSILNGSAMNVSGLQEAKNYNWSFLYNSVQDIDQILSRYDENELK